MPTVYVSIGNSDDKLTQSAWSTFHAAVDEVVRRAAVAVHGAWSSPSTDPWQNACWCIEVTAEAEWLRGRLTNLALAYQQDSIAWAAVPQTDFLRPGDTTPVALSGPSRDRSGFRSRSPR